MKSKKTSNQTLRCDFACVKNYEKSLSKKIWDFIEDKIGIRSVWDVLPFGWRMFYYDKIRAIFNPQNKRYRKSIPRTWTDVSGLIEITNFEFIKGFYEDEYLHGHTDWVGTGSRAVKFAKWLESAYDYITIERPQLEKQMWDAYPPSRPLKEVFVPCEFDEKGNAKMYQMVERKESYEDLYGEVNRLEKLIEDKDTKILTYLVKNRNFFWT